MEQDKKGIKKPKRAISHGSLGSAKSPPFKLSPEQQKKREELLKKKKKAERILARQTAQRNRNKKRAEISMGRAAEKRGRKIARVVKQMNK